VSIAPRQNSEEVSTRFMGDLFEADCLIRGYTCTLPGIDATRKILKLKALHGRVWLYFKSTTAFSIIITDLVFRENQIGVVLAALGYKFAT